LIGLYDITDIARMNKQAVELALKSDFKDFEGALQYYSAMDNDNIDIIVTRNIKDYKHSELAVMSPETFF